MQIALPTLLLLAGIIPGVAFFNAYFAGKFPRELTSLSPLDQLILYLFWALALDAGALYVVKSANPDYVQVLKCLLGIGPQFPPIPFGPQPLVDLRHWAGAVGWYFVFILSCIVIGALVRRLVWSFRLDVKFRMLRLKPDWYYVLQGRLHGLPRRVIPEADVLVSHPGTEGSRLYAGTVLGFEVTSTGDIKELVLGTTSRHKGRGEEAKLAEIPGARFIVIGSTIHSINMRYSAPDPPADRNARRRYDLASWWRSFRFEEP